MISILQIFSMPKFLNFLSEYRPVVYVDFIVDFIVRRGFGGAVRVGGGWGGIWARWIQ